MNDKETYGVELQLITNKFKQKLDEIKYKMSRIKDNFMLGLNYDQKGKVQLITDIASLQKKIKEINAQRVQVFPGISSTSKELEALNLKLEKYNTYLRASQRTLNRYNTTSAKIGKIFYDIGQPISKVGNAISNFMPKLTSIKDKLVGLFKSKDVSTFGTNIKSAFSKGISSIKRFAMGLLGVRGIYGLLTKAVRQYLSEHEGLSNQLKAMYSGIGSLLAPAIEYVINLFSKLLSYVNEFIKMLTGVDLFAKGMASINKSAKGTAKSVKEIKGGLAGIDELTNIAQDNNDSGGSGAGTSLLPIVDTAPLEKLKSLLGDIFKPFKEAWEETKENFIGSFKSMVKGLGDMFGSIGKSLFKVWTNGTGKKTLTLIINIFSKLFGIIGNIANAISKAWNNAENGTGIIQSIANIFNSVLEFVDLIADSLLKWTASDGFQKSLNFIIQLLKDIIGYVDEISKWIVDMYKKYLKPVVDEAILPAITDIINALGELWNTVKPVVDKIIKLIKTILEPAIDIFTNNFKSTINTLKTIVLTLVNTIKIHIDTIKSIFSGVIKFIKGVFSGDWNKAWEGIKEIFVGIWNGIKRTFENIINTIKKLLEGLVDKVKSTVEKAYNWIKKLLGIGGSAPSEFVDNLAKKVTSSSGRHDIPELDVGTNYVERSGLAYLHQGEAVVPEKFNSREHLGNDEETKDLLRDLIEAVENKDTVINLDGRKVGQSTVDYINDQKRKLGRSVV